MDGGNLALVLSPLSTAREERVAWKEGLPLVVEVQIKQTTLINQILKKAELIFSVSDVSQIANIFLESNGIVQNICARYVDQKCGDQVMIAKFEPIFALARQTRAGCKQTSEK